MKIKITKPNGETSVYNGKLIAENAEEILLETEDGIVRITLAGCASVEKDKQKGV